MNAIYSDIFDITKGNMNAAGMDFTISKEAYLKMSESHPVNADIYELSKEKNNRTFIEKAYVTLLKRYADERAFSSWERKINLPSEEFQQLCVPTIMNSPEFAGKNVDVYNNIYSPHNAYHGDLIRCNKFLKMSKNADRKMKIYYSLKKIYDKFPEGIKKILRKLLKKGR